MSGRDLTGVRVLVVGMGKSGVAAARLALHAGAVVTCTDQKGDAAPVEGARLVYGRHDEADFRRAQIVVVSPGVPEKHPLLAVARSAGAEVVSELGFAFERLDVPVLAVTGTNGKSTTTFLLGQLLEQAGQRPFVGGNLGTPLSLAVGGDAVGRDFTIAAVEVSSYQLELPGSFHPRAAAILNLQPDHLARHGDLETYAAAKCRIFARMGEEDLAVVGPALPGVPWPLDGLRATLRFLGREPGVVVSDRSLRFSGTSDDGELELGGFPLLGGHNAENLGAAMLLALHAGVRRSQVRVSELRGLPHRLELVVDGPVRFIDDSKATNVDAALIGIGAVVGSDGSTVVLLGGEGKSGADYARLVPVLQGARVVCFGASGGEIAKALAPLGPKRVGRLEEAVRVARALTGAKGTVLLSPACASFDEFRDFEDRGQRFRAWAQGET
jgi:UDP-N-acetylmuramoylalanine--D-glutamate ligase